jgi:6-hydroxytryprostatin B O-methyltransferase
MVKWPGSEEPNEGCFQLAYNMNESVFSYFAKDMMKLKRYGMAMSSSTDTEGYQLDFLVAGFDWASLGEATVVDVRDVHFFPFGMKAISC